MFAVLQSRRKFLARAAIVAASMTLAACEPISMSGGGPALDPSEAVPVALLVPSGSGSSTDALMAKSLENAARLAMADLDGVRIDLRVYSTAGQPGQASAMASRAVDEGAKIILGPLYAQNANAAGLAVKSRGVNVLSFSNNVDVAGGNVFILGPTFANTANRIVRYAAGQGRRNIMIVHAQTPAGELARRAVEQTTSGSSARLVATAGYQMSQNGITAAAPQIVATARANAVDFVILDATTDGALPLLSQSLKDNGLTAEIAQLGGLARWDVPRQAVSLPGLQGGVFAMPSPELGRQFESRYTAAYGSPPVAPAVVGLAYDGIAAIGALAKRGSALSGNALTQGSGFAGVNGVFRLKRDGTNERGLALAQIRNSQVVVIDPAPRSFRGAGF